MSWLEKEVSYIWCDASGKRTIEPYLDPAEAIRAGLRRAACVACREEVAITLEERPWRADQWPQGRREAAMDGHLVLFATGHACCACSGVEGTDKCARVRDSANPRHIITVRGVGYRF